MPQRTKGRFAKSIPRNVKRRAGRTPVDATPLAVRTTGVALSDAVSEHAVKRLGRRLGKYAARIERVTVRLEDVNGPRGGDDIRCSIKVVLSGMDSLVYEATAHDVRAAIDSASHGIARVVRKALDRAGGAGRLPGGNKETTMPRGGRPKTSRARPASGSLIGRRVGRSKANLEAALERPEKTRRDAYVDTSAPGVSATDRRAGGGSTARRNTKRKAPKATATLEDSMKDRPSRKSSRKSANRAKQGSKLRRRQVGAVSSPKARASRARARQ